ncbi:MAG: flagellar export protein FliJ [Pirellulales bacterium]
MSKYRFRLETLQKIRSAHRDQLRAALADAYRAEQILSDQRTAVRDEMASVRASQRAALSAAAMDVNQVVEFQRYETVLESQQRLLGEQANRLAIEVERRRLAVVEADRSVRVLEKLDERRRKEHWQEQQRLETKELDEIAVMHRRPV